MIHKKTTGASGEMYVAYDLLRQGYVVFKELGDNSHVDLIAIIDKQPIRIQVKTTNIKQISNKYHAAGVAFISTLKCGPNGYRYKYDIEEIDVFAIYVKDKNIVLYINAKEIGDKRSFSIRFDKSKNAQSVNVNMYDKYLNILDSVYKTNA